VTPTVFVSRPSLLAPEVESRASGWESALVSAGVSPVRLRPRDYEDAPWPQLTRLIALVDGVVVLGFHDHASPWLQLEAGMALMIRKPVLVIPEPGLTDGIFDPSVWTGDVTGLVGDPARGFPEAWLRAVRGGLTS
jgi:hypothetical protein